MTYEYEGKLLDYASDSKTYEEYKAMTQELQEVYRKAKAFDNYIVDLAKTMEEYPDNYIKSDNFAKETFEFYMKSKEDFIKAYENEVGLKHELIHDIAEYDRLLSDFEGE
ncbi:hypothetical protein ABDK10_05440 [Staphylococcus aureus]